MKTFISAVLDALLLAPNFDFTHFPARIDAANASPFTDFATLRSYEPTTELGKSTGHTREWSVLLFILILQNPYSRSALPGI